MSDNLCTTFPQADAVSWPRKHNLLGVSISATGYEEALDLVVLAAKAKVSACISHLAVHGLVEGSGKPTFRSMLNQFDIVAPDGHPVRLALNLMYRTRLPDRCAGPDFMLRVVKRAALEGIGIYLYGSHPHVVAALKDNLIARYQGLRVLGAEPSLFRPLSDEEDLALVHRINASGASIVFLGLGCPLQEMFAYAHKVRLKAVQICVGAAFDFFSGNKRRAPVWMQRYSLEWLFRLAQDPQRLWRRYLTTNTVFLAKVFLQFAGLKQF